MALLAVAAPLVAMAGVKGGLLPQHRSVPLWYLLLAAPVWEELLFRRAVQQRLLFKNIGNGRVNGFSRANWITAVFFVMLHLPFQGWRGLLVVVPSLALGHLFEHDYQVIPCVIMHSWFNICWVLVIIANQSF